MSERQYWDADVWVKIIEETQQEVTGPFTTLFGLVDAGSVSVIFSAITLAEVLARPEGQPSRPWPDPSPHDDIFDVDGLLLVQVDREIGELARGFRRAHKLDAADALHLACAAYHSVERFLTGDGLSKGKGPLHLPQGAISRRDGKPLIICTVQEVLGGGTLFQV